MLRYREDEGWQIDVVETNTSRMQLVPLLAPQCHCEDCRETRYTAHGRHRLPRQFRSFPNRKRRASQVLA